MLTTFLENYWTELHEIFRDDLSSSKDQLIRFWERSGQRSRSRSRKGQKRIFVIMRSVFVRFIWNQRQNVHFSIHYPLIWWQMWCWQRYALYRVVCMYVCYQLFSKTTGPNCMKFSGMIWHHPRTNRLDFGSDQVNGQGKGHEKVKTTGPNCMKFSGMICHHPRTNRLDFGSDQIEGQGQGHKRVKNVFLS